MAVRCPHLGVENNQIGLEIRGGDIDVVVYRSLLDGADESGGEDYRRL